MAFGLEIGDKKLWTALHTFTIEGVEEVTDGEPTIANGSAVLLGDHTIYQGDGVVYFVTAKVATGWVNLDVEVTDGTDYKAANVRVVSQGTVAYVPAAWMVKSKDGTKTKVLFGNVNNPSEETEVVLEIAFNTDPAIAEGEIADAPVVVIGTKEVTLPKFTVVKNVSTRVPSLRFLGFQFNYTVNISNPTILI